LDAAAGDRRAPNISFFPGGSPASLFTTHQPASQPAGQSVHCVLSPSVRDFPEKMGPWGPPEETRAVAGSKRKGGRASI